MQKRDRFPDLFIIAVIALIVVFMALRPGYYGGDFARILTVVLIGGGMAAAWFLLRTGAPAHVKAMAYGGVAVLLYLLQVALVDLWKGQFLFGIGTLAAVVILGLMGYGLIFRQLLGTARQGDMKR